MATKRLRGPLSEIGVNELEKLRTELDEMASKPRKISGSKKIIGEVVASSTGQRNSSLSVAAGV